MCACRLPKVKLFMNEPPHSTMFSETQVIKVGMADVAVGRFNSARAAKLYKNRVKVASAVLTFMRITMEHFFTNAWCSEFLEWVHAMSYTAWQQLKAYGIPDYNAFMAPNLPEDLM